MSGNNQSMKKNRYRTIFYTYIFITSKNNINCKLYAIHENIKKFKM